MKGWMVAVLVGVMLLAGCEQAKEAKKPIVWRAPPLVSAGVTLVQQQLAPERVGEAPLNGRVVEGKIVQNGKDSFQRYTVHSQSSMMLIEADMFGVLVKKGYGRQIKKEGAGVFEVDYVKSGDVTISGQYSDFSSNPADDKAQSKAVFSWKISG
ncbi:hypothetical protein [Phytopseudomonas dryadis]|uniref:Lipoprotein n=1 Tax=Phytopseudomonas dryadis TaxID=2487520 RepID=A0ABY1ZBE9_9GAMM|nr:MULTISPECIES: hypothetical protein [Pseudomonas]TBV08276.1 hypothetical protein DNK34_05975 [Pseudomonas dryadis]TBV19722.1 hypothetical protein DNK41_01600 [Pseudomonas sp. FRB 230]